MAANGNTKAKQYPEPTGEFGGDGDVLAMLFTVAYKLRADRAQTLIEQTANRTALRSMKSVMTPEQQAEVDALYHISERGKKTAKADNA